MNVLAIEHKMLALPCTICTQMPFRYGPDLDLQSLISAADTDLVGAHTVQ